MLKPAKDKVSRSKQRQLLHIDLNTWLQREKDMEIAALRGVTDVPEKLVFIRQEQAKLLKALRALDRGFTRQRAWSQGKLLY